jgi:protein-S-isoprenylcysteine O-methyltransferase Ste14
MIALVAPLFAAYLGLAFACVWQWGTQAPGSRIDVFSGGYFAAAPLWIAEYLIFLEQAALQGLGLVVWALTPAWLLWADVHLGRHFASAVARRHVLTEGPFRIVGHPRYAGLLASRAAFALVFASAPAWILFVVWVGVVLRRIRREERHLVETFGEAYAAYAEGRPRLVPGVY